MTNQQHPITPPPELVQQWVANATGPDYEQVIATQAACWGANQELEACCEYLARCAAWLPEDVQEMVDLRRPKPPSLKEQALEILGYPKDFWSEDEVDTIRRALEQLND